MPAANANFYMNVFSDDWTGHLLLEDRQYILDFKIKGNVNQSTNMVAWQLGPYNTVGNNVLTFNYSIDAGVHWNSFTVTLTSGSAQTADQVVADLNGNSNFAGYFTASVQVDNNTGNRYVNIQTSLGGYNRTQFKVYISNTSAETILRFNLKAGVAELPLYFDRHTVSNYINHGPVTGDNTFPDSMAAFIQLNQPTDNFYITNAGLSTTAEADWQLLRGRSALFSFQNITVDGSNRITQIIEYPAGALAGDLAKKTQYTYTGSNSNPSQITEIPYVLASGDLVTPP